MSRDDDVNRQRKDEKIDSFFHLQDIRVASGDRLILKDINVDVPYVSGVGIVGLSGSGKTTMIRCLLGLIAHQGRVDFLGHEVSDTHDNIAMYRKIGVLFQQAALFNDLTVYENCTFAQSLSQGELCQPEKVDEVLKRLHLWEARNQLPRQLSGGMAHRAGLARTLVRNSECLILDEPSTGQDDDNAQVIQDILLEYQQSGGKLIVISHDYQWLKPLIQWSVLVHEGQVTYAGDKLMTIKSTQEVVGC